MTPTFDPRCLWHDRNAPAWETILAPWMGKPNVRALEVGCFEGRATLWLLEHVLTDLTSTITVIDTFQGSPEHDVMLPDYDWDGLQERFEANVAPHWNRVDLFAGDAEDVLAALATGSGFLSFERMHCGQIDEYDLIYLDGSHRAADVLTDAVLAWRLLKPGGLLIADDWDWVFTLPSGETLRPRVGLQAFADVFGSQCESVRTNGAQLFMVKR